MTTNAQSSTSSEARTRRPSSIALGAVALAALGACQIVAGIDARALGQCASSPDACVPACLVGQADCDGDPSHVCETDTLSSSAHCGACGVSCARAHTVGAPTCVDGTCVAPLGCELGYRNCDGDWSNGCEVKGTCLSGATCGAPSDCVSGSCTGSICDPPPDCIAIASSGSGYPDGAYPIDPDGRQGPSAPYEAYCALSGGGFALALKVDGGKLTFLYDAPIWTDETLLAPDSHDLSETEAKLQPFTTMPFGELRIVMKRGEEVRSINVPLENAGDRGRTLRAVFADGSLVPTRATRAGWTSLIDQPALDVNCNQEGLNLNYLLWNGQRTSARIGLATNDQDNCDSPDHVIGVGTQVMAWNGPPGEITPASAGNVYAATAKVAFAYVFVRSSR